MIIVFDMDNTLVDELGQSVRPGMIAFLDTLSADGHTLILWTQSQRARAIQILRHHKIDHYFKERVFREDYDGSNINPPKDIRRVSGDVLIDDSPEHIAFVRSIGRKGILLTSYRSGMSIAINELSPIYKLIRSHGRWKRLFGWLNGSRRWTTPWATNRGTTIVRRPK